MFRRFSTLTSSPPRWFSRGLLMVAVLGVSLAAPIYALKDPATGALTIAFWRMIGSALATVLLAVARKVPSEPAEIAGSAATEVLRISPLAYLAGVFLGVHFGLFFMSLDRIGVTGVVLVNTAPIFAALLSSMFLSERLRGAQWGGLAVAIVGVFVIFFPELEGGEGVPVGCSFAIVSAVCYASYYVSGRVVRRTTDLLPYVSRAYGAAALTLLVWALLSGESVLELTLGDVGVVVGLVVGPSLLGHTLLNWALRWITASSVNVIALGEPIGAAILMFALYGELLGAWTIGGGALVLLGIYGALRRSSA